jgi:hypothetical protein
LLNPRSALEAGAQALPSQRIRTGVQRPTNTLQPVALPATLLPLSHTMSAMSQSADGARGSYCHRGLLPPHQRVPCTACAAAQPPWPFAGTAPSHLSSRIHYSSFTSAPSFLALLLYRYSSSSALNLSLISSLSSWKRPLIASSPSAGSSNFWELRAGWAGDRAQHGRVRKAAGATGAAANTWRCGPRVFKGAGRWAGRGGCARRALDCSRMQTRELVASRCRMGAWEQAAGG